MPIPEFQEFMLPLVELSSDGKDHSLKEAIQEFVIRFGISEEERKELLPSGRQPTLNNRIGWASTYLRKAGLLESPKRGVFRITERGRRVLESKPKRIDRELLETFEEFREFRYQRNQSQSEDEPGTEPHSQDGTPEEQIESSIERLKSSLGQELLATVKGCSPDFFEQLVVDVVVGMGYGGSRQDAGRAVGKSGDGGVDGIIKEDRLGLDIIFLQAKRWDSVVGRPEVQKFAGALQGYRARKGVFITTSSFSKEAIDYVKLIDSKIVLIDGEMLAQLMIDHNIGVSIAASYHSMIKFLSMPH